MEKTEITNLIIELINLGEDKDELNYWLEIFDDLPEDKQALLYVNLMEELEALK
ncbi:MAG: hypothetical protein NTX82_07000 [Candidatus Parcubacteria bacterium]|nr:hypothetical protein [Candidatus Parcubacteria bacterium]